MWAHRTATCFHMTCNTCSFSPAGCTAYALLSSLRRRPAETIFLRLGITGTILMQALQTGNRGYDIAIANCVVWSSLGCCGDVAEVRGSLWCCRCRDVWHIALGCAHELWYLFKLPSKLRSPLKLGRWQVHVHENRSRRLSAAKFWCWRPFKNIATNIHL